MSSRTAVRRHAAHRLDRRPHRPRSERTARRRPTIADSLADAIRLAGPEPRPGGPAWIGRAPDGRRPLFHSANGRRLADGLPGARRSPRGDRSQVANARDARAHRHHLHFVDRLGLHLAGPPGDHGDAGGPGSPGVVPREHRRPGAQVRDLPSASPARPQLVARHQGVSGRTVQPLRLLAARCCRCRIPALARWINRWLLLRPLRRWMRAIGFERPIVWTFLPTPLALDLIHDIDPPLTIYYCIDDLGVELARRQADYRRASSGCSTKPTSCS